MMKKYFLISYYLVLTFLLTFAIPIQKDNLYSPDFKYHFPCISYNPFHHISFFNINNTETSVSSEKIKKDMDLLKTMTKCIRLYTVFQQFETIVKEAKMADMEVILGAVLYADPKINKKSLDGLIELANRYNNITSLIVGNETQLAFDVKLEVEKKLISQQQLIESIEYVRERTNQPVSTGELSELWIKHPEIAKHVDFLAVHIFPFWSQDGSDFSIDGTIQRFNDLFDDVTKTFPDKEVIIMETGWPTGGHKYESEYHPGLGLSQKYYKALAENLDSRKIFYNVVEAFDQPWKRYLLEGDVGPHWGIFNASGDKKTPEKFYTFKGVHLSSWQFIFILTNLIGLIILIFPLRCSFAGWLTALTMFSFFDLVIMNSIRKMAEQYYFSDLSNWFILIPTSLMTIFYALYRLFEHTEQIFRSPAVPILVNEINNKPLVSIHVPCRNENPNNVIRCIKSLMAQTYKNIEIILIDNNTSDINLWQPLQNFCNQNNIKFLHVEKLKGYKSGALNLALSITSKNAELIAVMDSDYEVLPNWIEVVIPYFSNEQVAGVQCPQDYNTKGSSLFQKAIYGEYQSFFKMGMVTRAEGNAIIQHGTMLVLRKKDVELVGGWDETSITEDTELGVRLLAAGKRLCYIDKSYGFGILPSSFRAYCNQRIRWAYGAARTFMKHYKLFAPWSDSLNAEQKWRFFLGWVPWIFSLTIPVFLCLTISSSLKILKYRTVSYSLDPMMFLDVVYMLVGIEFIFGGLAYYIRSQKSIRGIILSKMAGAALSIALARGIYLSITTQKYPFKVTNKSSSFSGAKYLTSYLSVIMCYLVMASIHFYWFKWKTPNLFWISLLCIMSIPWFSGCFLIIFEKMGRPSLMLNDHVQISPAENFSYRDEKISNNEIIEIPARL